MQHRFLYGLVGFLAALTSISSPGVAAGDTTGYVTMLELRQTVLFVRLSVPPAGTRPACATHVTVAGGFLYSATYAQQFYAALLSAQARGATVRILGTNDCLPALNVEDISRIDVDD